MLRDADVKDFLMALPMSAKQLIGIAQRKEKWPQDDVDEVKRAIDELSDVMVSINGVDLTNIDGASALSSMALMQLPRAMLLLNFILTYRPDFLELIIVEPGESGRDVQHKMVMINRLMLLARVNVINAVFSDEKCNLIKARLEEVS